jgi:hypothetical protein
MSIIVLIAGILCMKAVLDGGTRYAFLTVLLPVMMFIPADFNMRLPHLPPLSFEDMALMSLGVGMIFMDLPRWKFSRMDVWILVFLFTSSYSERIPWGYNGAFLHFVTVVLECMVPYIAGKLFLGLPGMRLKTINAMIVMLAIASAFAIPQCILKWNLYIHFWSHFFPGQFYDFPQVRHGLGRVEGPFGMAESCGIVILIGLPLAFWLKTVGDAGRPLKYGTAIIVVLSLTILMTQSRGPWLGLVIALCVASIGRAKRPLRRGILVFGLGLLVGVPLYSFGKSYVDSEPKNRLEIGSEVQTAQYREQMIDAYVPIAELGGAWGYGNVYPVVKGQFSIDNEYLLIWLTQGYVGLSAVILIFLESSIACARLGIKARSFQDRYLSFSLLGIVLGVAMCLGTVWLSSQAFMLLFLIVGWSQAILPSVERRPLPVPVYT